MPTRSTVTTALLVALAIAAGCQRTSAPVGARLALGPGGASVVIHADRTPDFQLKYLRATEWSRARATLYSDDLQVQTQVAIAPAALDLATGKRHADVVIGRVKPGAGYHLKLELIQDGPDGQALVVGTSTLDDVTLHEGVNDLSPPMPQGRLQADVLQPSALSGYVESLPNYGVPARMNDVQGLAVDRKGRVFFTDGGRLRMATPDAQGVMSVATIAGKDSGQGRGWVDGPGARALFQNPRRLAVGPDDALYVADTDNHVVRKVVVDDRGEATVSTLAGKGLAGYGDGPGAGACFNSPKDVAVDGAGNVYVLDTGNQRVRRVRPDGTVSTLAGSGAVGAQDGPGPSASFSDMAAIEVGTDGRVYVADNALRVLTPGPQDAWAVASVVSDDPDNATLFSLELAVGADGALYAYDGRLQRATIDALGHAHVEALTSGDVNAVQLEGPAGATVLGGGDVTLAIDPLDRMLIGEQWFVMRMAPDAAGQPVISRLLGDLESGTPQYDGPAYTGGSNFSPYGVTVGADGRVYATSGLQVWMLDPERPSDPPVVIAGQAVAGFRNGPGDTAQFRRPRGIACGPDGALYVADEFNEVIRRVAKDASGAWTVSTAAGVVPAMIDYDDHVDGPGDQAKFADPDAVAFDPQGALYVSEIDGRVIRKITFDAQGRSAVSTYAGQYWPSLVVEADGPAATAKFLVTPGLAFAPDGAFYTVSRNGRSLRTIAPDATGTLMVSTLVNSTFGFNDLTGTPTLLGTSVFGAATDAAGNVYLTDSNRIDKVVLKGGQPHVSVFSGGVTGFADGPVRVARFSTQTQGIASDGHGHLYVADTGNHLIRKITL